MSQAPARLHRRRLHRRDRPRQQPGARRHARGADHRRAGRAARRPRPMRWSWRSSRAPSPPAEAVAQSLAALRWLQAQGARQIYFKYCSTFDSTPAGQHRPGDRGADGCAAARDFTIATPGLPGQPAHGVQGPPVRRRRAAATRAACSNHPLTPMTDANLVRVLQAQTPAQGRADRPRGGRAGRAGDRASASTQLRARGRRHRDRRCDLQRRSAAPRPGARATCRWSPRARAWRSACRPTSASRPRRAPSALPPRGRLAGRRLGQLLARDQPAGAALHRRRAARRSRSIRCASPRATTWSREALAWAAPLLAHGPVLVYATAEPTRCKSVQAGSASTRPARWSRTHAGRDRARAGRARRAAAGGRRRRDLGRRACRRWASRSCRSARRSTPACRGAMRRRRRPAAPGCTSRSSPATSAPTISSAKPLRCSNERERRRAKKSAASAAACSSAATCTPRPATSACGCDERLPDHADRRLPGLPRPGAARAARRRRQPERRRPRQQDPRAASRASTPPPRASTRHALRHPHPQHALRRADAGRRRARSCCRPSRRTS